MARLVSLISIVGMLDRHRAVNDQVPILPSTRQEWNEDLQYFVSIALAFITGGLLAVLFRGTPHFPTPSGPAFFTTQLRRRAHRSAVKKALRASRST